MSSDALRGRVAVVAGATRGAGSGIAVALGEAGATVIVTRVGGVGIAAAVDHLDTDQVRTLAERVGNEHGHIDMLVNDIWGGELLKGGLAEWNTPIWKHDLTRSFMTWPRSP